MRAVVSGMEGCEISATICYYTSMTINQEMLNKIVSKIVEAVQPDRIYLFGSRAKGTEQEDSDIDLLILADMEESRRKRSIRIRKLFPEREFSIDVLVFRPEEFERQKRLLNSISHIVSKEGKVLYDRGTSTMGSEMV